MGDDVGGEDALPLGVRRAQALHAGLELLCLALALVLGHLSRDVGGMQDEQRVLVGKPFVDADGHGAETLVLLGQLPQSAGTAMAGEDLQAAVGHAADGQRGDKTDHLDVLGQGVDLKRVHDVGIVLVAAQLEDIRLAVLDREGMAGLELCRVRLVKLQF